MVCSVQFVMEHVTLSRAFYMHGNSQHSPPKRTLDQGLPPAKNSAGTPRVPVSISRSRTVNLLAGSLISWCSVKTHKHSELQSVTY